MITLLQVDISWIIAFQSIGSWLEAPMKFFSFLGSEEFFILALPVIYWSLDASVGLRVGVILLVSGGINDLFKLAFHSPRPYWVDSGIKPLAAETSFGLPSGHAQISVSVWGTVAANLRRRLAWVGAIFLMVIIGLSRPFLGVHFFGDVFGGWLLGALILGLFLRYWKPVADWAKQQPLTMQVFYAFLVSIVIVLSNAWFLTAWKEPGQTALNAWVSTAAEAGAEELPAPLSLNGALTNAGTLFGLLSGVAWMVLRGGWQVSGSKWKRLARYLLGLVGIFLIWYGLGAIFPRGEFLIPYILRYARYALLGFWVSAGAPWVFIKIKLT